MSHSYRECPGCDYHNRLEEEHYERQAHADPNSECVEYCRQCDFEEQNKETAERNKTPLQREWDYLSTQAQDMVSDLIGVKEDSDKNEMGMEPFERLQRALNAALDLLQADPHERLANAITRELDYVRQGLDRHREWMIREAGRRGRDEARFRQQMERDKETRTYRNAMAYKSRQSNLRGPAMIRQFQEDLRRVNHPNYRTPRGMD